MYCDYEEGDIHWAFKALNIDKKINISIVKSLIDLDNYLPKEDIE